MHCTDIQIPHIYTTNKQKKTTFQLATFILFSFAFSANFPEGSWRLMVLADGLVVGRVAAVAGNKADPCYKLPHIRRNSVLEDGSE
jgi:hypothetical protein